MEQSQQGQQGQMEQERLYDLIFIVRPATPEEDIKKVITGIEHTCAEKGGKIEKTEHWGTRRLAYKVAKHREGIYVYHQIRTGHGDLMAELERRLRVQDVVIKYLTIRLDEDLKLQKKLGDRREKRAARRPRRTPSAAPSGGQGGGSQEHAPRHPERSPERQPERQAERHVENAG